MPQDPKYQSGESPRPAGLPPGTIVSSDTRREQRLPPGQSRTRKWPVLDASGTPTVKLEDWKLEICGLVSRPVTIDWNSFRELPRVRVFADMHCVTRWSRLGNLWEGVAARWLVEQSGPLPSARFAILHGCDGGWTTNLPLDDLLSDDALLADTHDGELLSPEHGAPVRAVIPSLYAWKSAKWLRAIELSDVDRPGYWERGGYHRRGDPWVVSAGHTDGERFADPASPPPGAE